MSDMVTRQSYDVVVSKHNKMLEINSLNYKIATSWNNLPLTLKENSYKTIHTFVKHVKANFLAHYKTECNIMNCYICNT